MITKLEFENFTAFRQLKMNCSPGINIFIGENGTGKSHILKAIYAFCEISRNEADDLGDFSVLTGVFRASPSSNLIRFPLNEAKISCSLKRNNEKENQLLDIQLSSKASSELFLLADNPMLENWCASPLTAVFIPPKEILSNAPGFRSLYSSREVTFDRTYYDIIDKAFLPPLKNTERFEKMTQKLETALGGTIEQEGERFYLKTEEGLKLDFMLLAEGLRKLGLLWLLLKNGALAEGAVLCWDEPDANLNPKLLKIVVSILLELQQMGVQIFLSTHNYVLLKEFDLQVKQEHSVRFHALYRPEENKEEVKLQTEREFELLDSNFIIDTYLELYDRDIRRMISSEDSK